MDLYVRQMYRYPRSRGPDLSLLEPGAVSLNRYMTSRIFVLY